MDPEGDEREPDGQVESLRDRLRIATDMLKVLAEQTGSGWTLDLVKRNASDALRLIARMG